MAFQITTLMENTSPKACLAAEHGLSLLIEGAGCRVLYDTGSSPRFLKNAKALEVELDGLDALVLSHGHYDHTGGVSALLLDGPQPKAIYLGNGFFGPRYSKKEDGLMEIGAAIGERALTEAGIPCTLVGPEPVRLAEGLFLLSGFVPTEELEGPSPNMLRQGAAGLEMDSFQDEVVVVLETERELALISGCAHVGILSMCRQVEKLFDRPVTAFIGGTHLMASNDQRIRRTCDCLRERGMKRLGACHCSGERAGAYFEEHFPGFFRNNVGTRVTID